MRPNQIGGSMPLRDHFHAPLRDRRHWQGFHSDWASSILRHLNPRLPACYFAEPRTRPFLTDLPAQDTFEVRVYDEQRGARLVAAIELVSPANKDRPEHRRAFVLKCAG